MKNNVLVIGDIHEPVSRRGYRRFCRKIYNKYKCNQVVFIGDVVDWHGLSFFAHHPDAPGPTDEYKIAHKCIEKWQEEFPVATVCIGNHDARVVRTAESVGIPSKFLRYYADIWDTPDWDWVDDVIIDDVYYMHGIGYGGLHPAYNASKHLGMSAVLGHIHSVAGIKWNVSPAKRWFGMDVGCGIDDKKYAFAYGKHAKRRSVISCGVVIDGHPYHEMMKLEAYKR